MNPDSSNRARKARRIDDAATRTAQVQQELAVAEAELHLTNTVLGRALPGGDKKEDVRKAVEHNAVIEEKVGEAAEELQEVTELLQAEVSERQRLETELQGRVP